jgi:hypothetical protein
LEHLTQAAAASGQQAFQGFDAYLEHSGGFDVAHVLIVDEQNSLPLPFRQSPQCRLHALASLSLAERFLGAGRRIGLFRQFADRQFPSTSQPIPAKIESDGVQPRIEAATPRLPSRRLLPGTFEDFLRHILRLGPIAQHARSQCKHAGKFYRDEATNGSWICFCHALHEREVGILAIQIQPSRNSPAVIAMLSHTSICGY